MEPLLYIILKCTFLHSLLFKKKIYSTSTLQRNTFYISPVLAHACATPLSVILCNTDLALTEDKKTLSSKLEKIRVSAERLQMLLQDHREKEKSHFNLKQAIDKTIFFVKIKHDAIICSDFISLDIKVKGSSFLFQEALLCIMNNAIEAYSKKSRKVLFVYGTLYKNTVKIVIEDFGAGMNILAQRAAIISGISYKESGSGIGLPFARKVITQFFSGKLEIKSSINRGTRVTITFSRSS